MAPATVSGFIIPDGDSFPRTTHSVVAPPINVASDLDPNPGASTTTIHTVTSPTATATPITEGPSTPFPRGAVIAVIVLAILTVIGIFFFFVRRYFIHQRASKVTPARARAASQVAISGPTGFQHVSSADGNNAPVWNTEDKVSMNTAQVGRDNLRVQTDLPKLHEKPVATTAAAAANESPNKQKYTVNFGEMESGLHDHVRIMQFARRQDSF